jgi:tagaturonate epimerase
MKRSDPVNFTPTAGQAAAATVAPEIKDLAGLEVIPQSQVHAGGALLFVARAANGERQLGVLADPADPALAGFSGERVTHAGQTLLLAPLNHANAQALRAVFDWLRPRPLGLLTSAGCGDRLGLATPGHVRAAQAISLKAGPAAPAMIFAQQSIREMVRTGRTPDEVMDDATWGTFQEGWRAGVGADADHLKTPADIENCVAAGFTFFTIDPGDHVDSAADTAAMADLQPRFETLPWYDLESSPTDLLRHYEGRSYDLASGKLTLDEAVLVRAAVKYGRSIAHTSRMYRHLAGLLPADRFELEVSVDETETPTTHAEHIFIAGELRRLGVNWVSLAPRYVGRFEKGVDYIGDIPAFEADFAGHAAIAQLLGPYKLSLHSGSDKFSVYAIASRHARGLLHLKTAGTSYVEALRAVGGFDPALFRDIYAFAYSRYETDKASYHVSANLARVPDIQRLPDSALPDLLDQFDTRQMLHVTFGSVLTSDKGFRRRLFAGLAAHAEEYYAVLEKHFIRHLNPLVHNA